MSNENTPLEQEMISLDGVNYLVTAFPVEYGLAVMDELQERGRPSPQRVKEIIRKCVTINGKVVDDSVFNRHFARKYATLSELIQKIMEFNYGSVEEEDVEGNLSPATESEDTESL